MAPKQSTKFEEEVPYGTLDERGWEIPDPRPVEIPAGFERPESLEEMIQRMVRTNASEIAEREGYETFDEADDFDMPDEDHGSDPMTPYEEEFDPVLGRGITAQEFLDRREYYDQKYKEAYQREAEERQMAIQEERLFEPASSHDGQKAAERPEAPQKGASPAKEEKPEVGTGAPDA